jgi:hypothetical protein
MRDALNATGRPIYFRYVALMLLPYKPFYAQRGRGGCSLANTVCMFG